MGRFACDEVPGTPAATKDEHARLMTAARSLCTVVGVNRKQALGRLPERYAKALRLRDTGMDNKAIARSLGIPPEAVGPLIWVAEAKLAPLLSPPSPKP